MCRLIFLATLSSVLMAMSNVVDLFSDSEIYFLLLVVGGLIAVGKWQQVESSLFVAILSILFVHILNLSMQKWPDSLSVFPSLVVANILTVLSAFGCAYLLILVLCGKKAQLLTSTYFHFLLLAVLQKDQFEGAINPYSFGNPIQWAAVVFVLPILLTKVIYSFKSKRTIT